MQQQISVPYQRASGLAATYGLGALRQEFKTSKDLSYVLTYIVLLGCGFTTCSLVVGSVSPFVLALFFSLPHNSPWSLVPSLVLIPLLALLAYFIFRGTYHSVSTHLFLYEHGLVLVEYKDRRVTSSDAMNWRDLASFYHDVSWNGDFFTHQYFIQRWDGSRFGGQDFTFKDERLAQAVEQETQGNLTAWTFDTYQRAQPVSFGALVISTTGLEVKGVQLSWPEVGSITIDNEKGSIRIQKRNNLFIWKNLDFKEVPNVQLLGNLLTFICNQQGPLAFALL